MGCLRISVAKLQRIDGSAKTIKKKKKTKQKILTVNFNIKFKMKIKSKDIFHKNVLDHITF